jgi:adenine-specific DNA-methyltransferase
MNITEKNESKAQRVDVCETFNYLIGLTVQRQGVIRSYDSRPAAKPEYEGAVDLIKGNQFAFRQIEGTLPDGRKALVIWRTIGEDLKACNAALDAYFEKYRINPHDREYDVIYVNGDNNLENLCTADETWKVVLIEQEFNKRMFEDE